MWGRGGGGGMHGGPLWPTAYYSCMLFIAFLGNKVTTTNATTTTATTIATTTTASTTTTFTTNHWTQ